MGTGARQASFDASFDKYRRDILVLRTRWVSALAAILTPLGIAFEYLGAAPLRPLDWFNRFSLGAVFALIHVSTFVPGRSRWSGSWQSMTITAVGSLGATLLTIARGHWGVMHIGSLSFIVLACAVLFPWRQREMIPVGLSLLGMGTLPSAFLTPPSDFVHLLYLLSVSVVMATIGSGLSYRLRRKEYEARQGLESHAHQLAETSGKLEESVRQLREVNERKNQFFANVSHELRTPLTLLVAPLELLNNLPASSLPAEARWHHGVMRRNTRSLLRLIESLLDLVRIDAGQVQLERRALMLEPLLRQQVERFVPHASTRGVRIHLQADADLPSAWADEARIETIVGNLLSNAVRFARDGGSVRVSLQRAGQRLHLSVADDGPGISPDVRSRLFERFGRRDEAAGGLGIGLSLVRELVELHGGTVTCESSPGAGATFHVQLPAAPASAHSIEPQAAEPLPSIELPAPPSVETGRGDRPKVLVVEDDPDVRAMMELALRPRFEVTTAGTGKTALTHAVQARPQVVVSDVRLPDTTGLELLRALRLDPATARTPVILVTAYESPEARVEGLRLGAVDFVAKPFSPAELEARIEVQLRLQQLAAELARSERLAMMQTLVEGLAHEVRNPLNAIANATSLLRGDTGAEHRDELLGIVDTASEHIGAIINELTVLSRGDGQKQVGVWSPSASVHKALRLLAQRCEGVRIQEELAFEGSVPGHPAQLDQAVMNVLDNAVRAMPGGGELRIRTEERAGQLCLTVSDSGPGITPESLPRIFDPFFTTRKVGDGTGLGLHLCRRVIEAHAGRIEVASKPGRGASFTLRLPLATPLRGAQ